MLHANLVRRGFKMNVKVLARIYEERLFLRRNDCRWESLAIRVKFLLPGERVVGLCSDKVGLEYVPPAVFQEDAMSAAPLVPRQSAASTGGHTLAVKAERDFSPIGVRLGTTAHHALRLKPDHPMGAGHPCEGQHESRRPTVQPGMSKEETQCPSA